MAIRILGGTKETLTLELEVSGDAQKAVFNEIKKAVGA